MEPIRITADILRNISMTMPLITQHDSGREIVITVKQDGQDIPLDNDIIYTITSRRDDGETFLSSPGVKTNVNEVTFRLGSSEVEKIGNVNASIQMYLDGLRVSTLRFGYKVVEDLSVDYVPSEDEQTLIEMVLYEGPEIMRAAQEATELALEAAEIANNSKGEKGDTGEKGDRGEIGPEGPKGDTGLQGEQGERGEIGPKGDTGEQGPQGDPGPKGDDGDVGPRGEKGEQGTGLSIVGKLDSEDELPESGSSGEAYLIKGDIYVWDGDFWTNMGSIQGPQGETGARGEDGEQGLKGDPFLYSDFTPEQLEGLKGPQGDVGPKGEDGTQVDISGKVDKIEGKGLSTEDFTTEDKEKLEGLGKIASEDTLGLIKVGDNLRIDEDGTLHAEAGGGGSIIPLGNVEDLVVDAELGLKASLSWSDPSDIIIEGITLAKLGGVMVRRKEGTYPVDEKDGVLVVDSKVRDEYSEDAYIDSGLNDGVVYYYSLFPYDTNGYFTIDITNRATVTAFNKYVPDNPSRPTVSDIQQNTALVTSSVNAVVSLNGVDWFSSPHVFTDLVEGDEYTPYAKFEENDTHWESTVISGDSFIAVNKLPQDPPSNINISNLEYDRFTATSDVSSVLSINGTDWYPSPHVFTGLNPESGYTVRARFDETLTHLQSDIIFELITTPSEQQIYGVRIDKENSNPETRVTYIGDSIGFSPMRGNNGNLQWGSWEEVFNEYKIRPVVLQNSEVNYYLDPNDYSKKEDGSDAVITGDDGDVMVEFGKPLWWKWTDEGNTYTIEVSDKEFPGAVKHAFEIEDGYNQTPYYPLLLVQILTTIFLKSTDSQSALGRGRVDGTSGYANTGGTDSKGMFYGSDADEQIKLFGIEDFWGNKNWFIDGIVIDNARNILIGKSGFNNAGNGYELYERDNTSNVVGYTSTIEGGNDKGFINKSAGGSETTYYSDYGALRSSSVAIFGGHRNIGSQSGAFYLRLYDSSEESNTTNGARLFCARNGKIYIGAYLGSLFGGGMRSVSGIVPIGNRTIDIFRTQAKNNNHE